MYILVFFNILKTLPRIPCYIYENKFYSTLFQFVDAPLLELKHYIKMPIKICDKGDDFGFAILIIPFSDFDTPQRHILYLCINKNDT